MMGKLDSVILQTITDDFNRVKVTCDTDVAKGNV